MSGKGLLVFLAGIFGLATTIFVSLKDHSNLSIENFAKTYYFQTVNNIAQSGANRALREIAENPSWKNGIDQAMLGGRCLVRVVDTTYNGAYAIKVTSVGQLEYKIEDSEVKDGYISDTLIVLVGRPPFTPPGVRGAITSNFDVDLGGTTIVDGRDYNPDGITVRAQNGTLGIWTTKGISQGGNCTIGGTSSAHVDYVPSKPAAPPTISTGQSWPGGRFPTSPDSLMGADANGYPEGTLKTMALSGFNGSQYTTDPTTLRMPLSGVTYVELPNGGIWQPGDIRGTGILIVHNSKVNAEMKNINFGAFTGIAMADRVNHCHTDIVGALIGISPVAAGNSMGNGQGTIKYSSQAVRNATSSVFSINKKKPSTTSVLAWIEGRSI